ncbi:MAG TPA: S53 family peptidase [Pseudonocardiaceae bacterium]|jgi:subtilase family serine protease
MKNTRLAGILAGAVTLVVAVLPALPASAAPTVRDVCGAAAPGYARCFAEVRTDTGTHTRTPHALPDGYGPADLRAAYKLPDTGGANQTVAIVDAGDDATAEADLGVYRSTYGLPACTTANGCFRKVDQQGKASPLPTNQGWGIEISLDLDMVSAACPACHILLVEGDSASFDDLGGSVNTAVALGATEVSNSYGGTEFNGSTAYAADYTHPGVAIVASSGDAGYGVANTPAAYQSVIAVGGTTLTKASNARGWSETAWAGASSGCSAWIDKPSWQHDPNCPGRMVADVAADADPNTGPAVYDAFDGYGWLPVGGTSASSPFIAGVIALAGNPGQYPNASYFYSHAAQLNDVTSGNNSASEDCGGDYQCNAVAGYDGPTGLGTPNGIGAF